MSGSWVDVRDIAMAHALALEKEDAGGQRVIISAGSFIWQEWGMSIQSDHRCGAFLIVNLREFGDRSY